MKKYIFLFIMFMALCIMGYATSRPDALFVGAIMVGYCWSKIQYKYTKKYKHKARQYQYI